MNAAHSLSSRFSVGCSNLEHHQKSTPHVCNLRTQQYKAPLVVCNIATSRVGVAGEKTARRGFLQTVLLATGGASIPLWFPVGTESLAEEARQAFDAITSERFAPLAATFQLPEGWSARPGQKPKPGKFMLYTDTYGPNYRYFSNWPKVKNEEGICVDSIEVLVQGLSGVESIADLGTIDRLDPQRAFGIAREDLQQGDIASSAKRVDANGQVYYEWKVDTTEGTTVLVSATASGGALYTLAVGATPEQWTRGGDAMQKMLSSFTVAPAEESSVDVSGRIYGTRKEGGFN